MKFWRMWNRIFTILLAVTISGVESRGKYLTENLVSYCLFAIHQKRNKFTKLLGQDTITIVKTNQC